MKAVSDITYPQATSDTTFALITEKTFSDGSVQSSSKPVTKDELATKIESFLEFLAREYQYAAIASCDLNRKISLVNNANSVFLSTAQIDNRKKGSVMLFSQKFAF